MNFQFYNWLLTNRLAVDEFFDWLYDFLDWGEFEPPEPDEVESTTLAAKGDSTEEDDEIKGDERYHKYT